MGNPIIAVLLLSSGFMLACAHIAALTFGLHYIYPWLDLILHALGGIVVALGFWLILEYVPRYNQYVTPLRFLLGVFCVGLLWEVFEIAIGVPLDEPGFIADTALDLGMDLVGGSIGYYLARRLSTM